MNCSITVWCTETTSLLRDASDAPELDTAWLIEHVTGFTRAQQRADSSLSLTSEQLHQLNALRQRRIQGEPLAYILQVAHFWTLKLKVSPAVLIPRPETELVVERSLHHLPKKQMSVLDLATGSGAIALAIASERPKCKVFACDVSEDALAVARENSLQLNLSNIEIQRSDWFGAIHGQRFDIIVSNPPYIAVDDPNVQTEVRVYEPHLALFAGADGLSAIQIIVHQAPHYLNKGGWLILEHGWQQATKVQELLESRGFDSVASHIDLAGHLRVTEARYSST